MADSKIPADVVADMSPTAVAYLQGIEKQLNTATADNSSNSTNKSNILRTVNDQTGTTYTFALTDSGAYVRLSNAAAITATVPAHTEVAFEAGTQIDLIQAGAGKLTIAAGSGVTINSANGNKSLSARYAGATLIQTATQDTWDLIGGLIP